ncbi:MAG: RtcB family protein [Candidatus ainarchaeum sp.]|nr:RtcB family protein [Candidatus ainarchaeum sp.]
MMNKIFAKNIDEPTLKQFTDCLKEEFVIDGALMPDAHFGYVAPIGAVLITKDFVVPSWVGYDIGCGVTATKISGKNILEKIKKNRKKIFDEINSNIPMGLGKLNAEHKVSKETKKDFLELLKKLEKKEHDKELLKWLKRKALSNLGTLGHGNHFIEIDYYKDEVWLIIHSGSRHVGHRIAGHYMKKAMELQNATGNAERTFAIKTNSILGKEYLNILDFCLEFALLNRIEMTKNVLNIIELILNEKLKWNIWTNKNHNHAERIGKTNKFIHRKGATPSKKGEKGVIPANMRDGCYLVIGKGNKDFLESSSHGAGRSMSKRQAKETINLTEFQKTMRGITATIENKTIDESPFAYKKIDEVMKAQEKSIKILKKLKPIINCKG